MAERIAAVQRVAGYQVEPATLRDVHAIRRLEQVIFSQDAYSYMSLTTLLMWPGQSNFKAVTPEGNLVGFVAGAPNWATHVDWIVTLGVHPNHQGRGLGRWLLETCETSLSQASIYLTARISNDRAIRLYETAGYRRMYIEHHYYSDGEDGVVMGKERVYPDDATGTDS
ncbi:MAG TPA: GNAT family N-acetyltransferase [Aggregatilineales bacterium]|nr:GNAT family N-acetyltransferase [Aggregatilineales bacterium]